MAARPTPRWMPTAAFDLPRDTEQILCELKRDSGRRRGCRPPRSNPVGPVRVHPSVSKSEPAKGIPLRVIRAR